MAAASNQVEIITFLTGEAKVDLNVQDSDDNTALHLAVSNGHVEATNVILGHMADDCICNKDQRPALHLAIEQGARGIKLVSEFIKNPNVNLFVRGYHDYTTLHVIAKTNNLKALELIHNEICERIQDGVSRLLLKDRNGLSAFHVAARVNSHGFLDYLLVKCVDYGINSKELLDSLSSDNRSVLHYATEHGHIEGVRVLLTYGGDPTSTHIHHPPPLHLACSHGKLDVVKVMVDVCGSSILQSRDQEGGTTLHSSTSSIRSEELISYLVENGVQVNDVDSNGFSPLSNAIQLGSVSAIDEIMGRGGDPCIRDRWGNSCLHRAVMGKRMEVFKKIASTDAASVMAASPNNQGNYPIHLALKLGLTGMVDSLLAMTPSEMFKDSEGNNYMHLTATSDDERSISHLLSKTHFHYMINEANFKGFTPLHYAAMGSSVTLLKKLRDYGAVIHKNNKGFTPFMCACSKGNLEAAKLLYYGNKFQRDWIDHYKRTALHLAVDGGNPEVITFCLDEGMAITLDDHQLSFIDKILGLGDRKLAKAAVSHRRWNECIDLYCPDKSHPILRILDKMPDVYGIILDQCFTKCGLDPTHPDYWEEFNFKCLNLKCEDVEVTDSQEENNPIGKDIEMVDLDEYDPIHTQLHTESDVAVENVAQVQRSRIEGSQRRRALSRWRRKMLKDSEGSLAVVRKLIKNHQEAYLLHPVVASYIKLKWEGFGLYFQTSIMIVHFLLALFFSIFVVSLPPPLQILNSTSMSQNESGIPVSAGSQALLYISLLLTILNLVVFILQVYIHGLNLILDFTTEFQVWSNLIASSFVLIFVVSVLTNGLLGALWNTAAIGVFFAWFSVGFTLQLVNVLNIGVYITMMMSTTRLILKVLMVLFVFVLAFAFSFQILVGSVDELQYRTAGLSLYSNLHSLIAVTDYLGFARIELSNGIRFSVLVFMLLVALIIMLPIVFINLLIGLAVGDIAHIQKEAIISWQSVEVRALASLDKKLLPSSWKRHLSKRSHKNFPNRMRWGALLTKFFHRTFDSNVRSGSSLDSDLQMVLKQELAEERELHEKHLDKLQEQIGLLAADQIMYLDGMKRLEDMLCKLMELRDRSS